MPTFSITIGGVSKDLQRGTLEIRKTANQRGTASFEIASTDGSYRPALDAEVVITIDGTRVFGGLVDRPSERGVFRGGPNSSIKTKVNCYDFNHYAERRFVEGTIAAGSLKSKLQSLVAEYLAVFGVSLDAGQVDGPSLPEQKFNFVRLSDVFSELVALTADFGQPYAWRIDDFKVLRFFQPSTTSAPFNLDADAEQVEGDVQVETTRDHYANRVFLKVPAKQQNGRIESFTGDGSTSTFPLQYTPTKLYGHILSPSTGGGETLGGEMDGGQWTYDPASNAITRNLGAPPVGNVFDLYFDGIFEGTETAEDPSAVTSPWEKVVVVEEVPEGTTAQALADGYLAAALPPTRRVKYRTRTSGLLPGQSQAVTIPKRGLSDTLVITDVVIKDYLKTEITYDITAVFDSETNLDRGWQDLYKVWRGDKLGAGTQAPSTVSTGAGGVNTSLGAAPPLQSFQFNRNYRFGGRIEALYHEQSATAMFGLSHTPGGFINLLIGEEHVVSDPQQLLMTPITATPPSSGGSGSFDASVSSGGGFSAPPV